jgi:hypothetical protein
MEGTMDIRDRKAAIAAYKERKPAYGVYAVVCAATGDVWVGRTRHVDTQQNGMWFALRQGSCPHRSLQAAWTLHGEREFRFEELERLGENFPEFGRLDELKRRAALWRVRLHASAL